jgi:anion transporter
MPPVSSALHAAPSLAAPSLAASPASPASPLAALAPALLKHWRRRLVAAVLAIAFAWTIWTVPTGLSDPARIAIGVFGVAVIGWTRSRLGDTPIALAAALVLVLAGVVSQEQMFATLGHDLIWLLVAAFVLASVIRASGLAERLALALARRFGTVAALFRGLTLAIAATAFIIPSTSGRAALLLPVFLALSAQLADARLVRALALLFPTAILLSAGGSLIGAGAHLVAVEFMRLTGGPSLDFLGWMLVALPFALATTCAATEILLRLFLTRAERARPLALSDLPRFSPGPRDLALIGLLAGTVLCWMTAGLHGVDIALVTLAAALLATSPLVSNVPLKSAVRSVEWDLLLFMAATLLMGDALLATNADEWVARRMVMALGGSAYLSVPLIVLAVIVVSLAAHLVITSRTARATVLIPTLVLPLAGLGLDPAALILIAVMGTGFCQTLAASAKPVALYAQADGPGSGPAMGQGDLLRLSLALAPMMVAALLLFAFVIWPLQGISPWR